MANDNCTHYWIIDSSNVGHCKYCPTVRDFGRLLGREGFGVRSKSKNGGTRGKRGKGRATIAKIPASAKKSLAARERWQVEHLQGRDLRALNEGEIFKLRGQLGSR